MTDETETEITIENAPQLVAGTINKILSAGVPIPFILSTLCLIQHNLAGQHIERSNAMAKLAEASKNQAPSVETN